MKHQYDIQQIAQLIEKFMAGTTSIAEEDVLAQYFRTHEVSEEWTVYKEMFALFDAGEVDIDVEAETDEQAATPQRAKTVAFNKWSKKQGEPHHTSTASRWIWPAVAACMVAVFFLGRTSKGVDEQVSPQPVAAGTKVIYASTNDTTYQSPALVDEFIAKLASYNGIEQEMLDCTSTTDATNYLYVFPNEKEVDVFAHLLQIACWYNKNTPGYQLRMSQDEFYFELSDTHEGRRYMWLAEKIGDNTFLYGVNAPTGVGFSNTCYMDFRDKHAPLNKKYLYYKL
jgi:hypothetical protein